MYSILFFTIFSELVFQFITLIPQQQKDWMSFDTIWIRLVYANKNDNDNKDYNNNNINENDDNDNIFTDVISMFPKTRLVEP